MQCPYCQFIYKVSLDKIRDVFIDTCPRCGKDYKSVRMEKNIFKGEKLDGQD